MGFGSAKKKKGVLKYCSNVQLVYLNLNFNVFCLKQIQLESVGLVGVILICPIDVGHPGGMIGWLATLECGWFSIVGAGFESR